MHDYPGPDSPEPEPNRAAVLGEFGGFGLSVTNHLWPGHSWGYTMLTNDQELAAHYTEALKQVWKLHSLRGLSAAVYTQTADVETECDGLETYDRAVAKIPADVLLAANQSGLFDTPQKIILPDGLFGRADWRYTTAKPADNWCQAQFDDSGWKEGIGGFGSSGTPGVFLNTEWGSDDIWLRRSFTLEAGNWAGLKLHVFHDEDAEIYLNGALAARLPDFITDYAEFDISSLAASTLHAGENVIAVHCHQTTGGQGIDVGIVIPQNKPEPKTGR
jgi:hypothetical protein